MSASTDYTKLKVTELKDLLQKRALPTQGLKAELIARLTAADSAAPAASSSTATTPAPAASASTPQPTTETKPAEPTPAPASTETPAADGGANNISADGNNKKRKTIASLFDAPAPPPADTTIPAPVAAGEPDSPNTVTGDGANKPATETTDANADAKPAVVTIDEEIERRKKRAERFGLNPEESEALKKLERAKRFGSGDQSVESVLGSVSGKMDQALPERKKQRTGGDGGRGRGDRHRGGQGRRHGNGPGRNQGARNGAVKNTMSEEDRKKAEERKKRFGSA